jgi:phosphoglycolate phosphatase-like HAD superfamily hydrolase
MKQAVIFDIDGTIANIDHRLHHIQNKPKKWNDFFKECRFDKPIASTINLLKSFMARDIHVILITGRREEEYEDTIFWLYKHVANHLWHLQMRPIGDYRPDYELKAEIAEYLQNEYEIIFAIDDKLEVVEAYTKLGIPTLHLTWDKTR